MSNIENSRQEPLISFLPKKSIQNLLGLNASTKYEEYNLSPNPVDILSFDNIFLETNIAKRNILKSRQSVIFICIQWMLILVIIILRNSEEENNGR